MFNISFDFNERTHEISNLQVIEKKEIEYKIEKPYDLEVLENKIQLTSEAIEKLGVSCGDRIAINYWYSGPNNAYPIISKADVFEGTDGLKLTKSKTLAFRGEQRETLLKYGSIFSFEEWRDKTGEIKENVFKLIPVTKDNSFSDEKIVEVEETTVEKMNQKELEDDAEWLMEL